MQAGFEMTGWTLKYTTAHENFEPDDPGMHHKYADRDLRVVEDARGRLAVYERI